MIARPWRLIVRAARPAVDYNEFPVTDNIYRRKRFFGAGHYGMVG